jgi:acetylornithine/N-succinyldiaminopimelate aminotransferase
MMNTLDMSSAEIQVKENATQIPTYSRWPLALVTGSGSYVTDADDKSYLDFYGGHCVTLLGHCHPDVVSAVQTQAETLMFYSNVVYSDIRAKASEILIEQAGKGADRVYFCNSGTEANETALKIARKMTGKQSVIAMEDGFHGRTLGSLAATWNSKYREPYGPSLAKTHFVPFGNADAVQNILDSSADIAALILEPIQSMAGIVSAPAEYFQSLRNLCDKHDVALIFDEIQTGVGRTGTFLFSESLGICPDMTTLAKSLGSGVPVGAVLTTEKVAVTIQPGDQGTTFGGGMLASAAVLSTLEIIVSEDILARVAIIFDLIRVGLGGNDITDHDITTHDITTHDITDHNIAGHDITILGKGCLIGLKFEYEVAPIVAAMRERGILVGGSSDPYVMRVMPPATASNEEVYHFVATLKTVVANLSCAEVVI